MDGVVNAGEYGTHIDGSNQMTSAAGPVWYMTWDDTNLYVAVTGAAAHDAAVIYIASNPPTPVDGGSNKNGNRTGVAYDNTNFSGLPFRANWVGYFRDDTQQYATADTAGGWTVGDPGFATYAANGTTREVAIPWTAINGSGSPANFAFLGYLVSSDGTGNIYGQVPGENPSGQLGTSVIYTNYFLASGDGLPFANDAASDMSVFTNPPATDGSATQ